MKILIIILILWIPFVCYTNEWSPIGPDTIIVNDYLSSIYGDLLCTPKGIYLQAWGTGHENWEIYPSGLPVLQAEHYDTSGVLVILNGGTYSDGIYKFNQYLKSYELLEFCVRPNFIYQHQQYPQPKYYCGYQGGLLESVDGKEWQDVEYFKGKTVFAMATMGPNCLLNDSTNIYFSGDDAKSWKITSTAPPHTRNLCWDQQFKAYMIYTGDSRSSGLWSSADSGKTWDVEFWSTEMSALFYAHYFILVGWEKFYEGYGGVALWTDESSDLRSINEGLPKAGINRITQNDIIDCINAVVCTDSGAYIRTDFDPTAIQDNKIQPAQFNLFQNYPNPFNNETVIPYQLKQADYTDLSVYNTLGQKIITLVSAKHAPGDYVVHWNSNGYASGIYYTILKVGKVSKIMKMVLLK